MGRTWGPFDVYTEVETPLGIYGLRPGQVLSFTSDSKAVITDAATDEPVAERPTVEQPEEIPEGDEAGADGGLDVVAVGPSGR